MEELPKSHYYLTYDEIITKAQMIQPNFAADLAQFAAYDSWFTAKVNAQLLQGIHRGMNDFSDASLDQAMQQTKNMIDLQLAEARHSYEKLNYYVDIAFKDATMTNETFGYSDFTIARSWAKKMISLLAQVLAAISQEDNKARLLSAYMPPELPLELSTIASALAADYGELKKLKRQQVMITRERIELLNSLWDILSKICDDAKIIFANDPARLAIYELYDLEGTDMDQAELEENK
ncbi:MAG TPA: hypothetical protein DCL77_09405 [Prolixibacteraceae bacterium]|jgi:hypothetical protein|nr:hypothetical protein [Prolixibacteraceae bacterium]